MIPIASQYQFDMELFKFSVGLLITMTVLFFLGILVLVKVGYWLWDMRKEKNYIKIISLLAICLMPTILGDRTLGKILLKLF